MKISTFRKFLVGCVAVATVPLAFTAPAGAYDKASCTTSLKNVVGQFERALRLIEGVSTVTGDSVDKATKLMQTELAAAKKYLSQVSSGQVLPILDQVCTAAPAKARLGSLYVTAASIYLTAQAVEMQSSTQLAVINSALASRSVPRAKKAQYAYLLEYVNATKGAAISVNAELDKLVPTAATMSAEYVYYLEYFTVYLAARSQASNQALININA